MTLSADMCQFLTNRLTKAVRVFCTAIFFAAFFCLNALAQNEQEPVGVAPPEEQQRAINTPKLEAIDEDEVTYKEDVGNEDTDKEQTSAPETESAPAARPQTATPLSEEVEDLKKAALELNRDLLILEEELLFPANSQLMIFLSLDVGKFFSLDSVKVLIDNKLVASHLYTKRQNSALAMGGIQRLYLGNLKSGKHEVTAFFVGMGPDNREYKRGATINIVKGDEAKLLELKVRDSTATMQPEFEFEEWQL